jgi:uncharacterized protein involved in copper resistance
LDYVNGVERFSPVEVLTVEDLMRTHMMEREKKNKKNIYHVYRNKKPHGEKEKKTSVTGAKSKRVTLSKDPRVTRCPRRRYSRTHPPSFFACLLLEELISF